jgi:hypothetical protein
MLIPIHQDTRGEIRVPLLAETTSSRIGVGQRALQSDTPIAARVKVLDPLMTMGPSSPAFVLKTWDTGLRIKLRTAILRGSLVQVRVEGKLAFGRVQLCLPAGQEFEVSIEHEPAP